MNIERRPSSGFTRFCALGIAALLLTVLPAVTGRGTALSEEQEPGSQEAKLQLQKAEVLVATAAKRLQVAKEHLAAARAQMTAGVLHEGGVAAAKQSRLRSEAWHAMLVLDLEEVRLTGQAPKNDLSAPLVEERDFVGERIRLRQKQSGERIAFLESELERMKAPAMVRYDTATVEIEFLDARVESAELTEALRLRASFHAGEIDGREADLRGQIVGVTRRLTVANLKKSLMGERRTRVAALTKQGVVPARVLQEAEMSLLDAETDQRIAEIELKILESRL